MFVQAYLDTAESIILQYKGAEPLPSFLKKFFAANKKFGSRDRRHISHLCYCFFRLGSALPQLADREKMLAGLFLCSTGFQPVLAQLKPQWAESIDLPLPEKIRIVNEEAGFDLQQVFPFWPALSAQIEQTPFLTAFLMQPDTYLRLRPGKRDKVISQLQEAGLDFAAPSETCLALAPGAKLDQLLMLDKDAVIQDRSSQQVLTIAQPLLHALPKDFSAWDCCAASGGKSILLKDTYPACKLTVSDIRISIIRNLEKRFAAAGITGYRSFVADIAAQDFSVAASFDLVICDAPCSGSGTWSRSPEQAAFFTAEKLLHYAALQERIALNASNRVKKGGVFLYITCSVFTAENEAIVQKIERAGMKLHAMAYFKGYAQKADTLFAAAFTPS